MRKPSEVIRLAVENPRYLSGGLPGFLCNIIDGMDFTSDEKYQARSAIRAAIKGKADDTLFGFMVDNYAPFKNATSQSEEIRNRKMINSTTKRQPNDLRVQFWAVLCMDLVRKGS